MYLYTCIIFILILTSNNIYSGFDIHLSAFNENTFGTAVLSGDSLH